MRLKIAAGNWKMNLGYDDALQLAQSIAATNVPAGVKVILGSPFPYLKSLVDAVEINNGINISAQNCAQHEKGAYTGEVSASMLKSINVPYVIIGHSERRAYYNESDEVLLAKTQLALKNDLKVIFCCGESLEIREANEYQAHVTKQLESSIFNLSEDDFSNIVIAYEPIWAIGTGKTASPEQAQEIHALIRSLLVNKYGAAIAENTSILYGGSVKPANAKELFGQQDVDGGLVGGASLKAADFIDIINSF